MRLGIFLAFCVMCVMLEINSEQMTNHLSFSTCGQTSKCLSNYARNDAQGYLMKCKSKVSACDGECVTDSDTFSSCLLDKCSCSSPDPAESINWACFDNCKSQFSSEALAELVECIYSPCRPPAGSSAWIIMLIILFCLSIIVRAGFAFYRWRLRKLTPSLVFF